MSMNMELESGQTQTAGVGDQPAGSNSGPVENARTWDEFVAWWECLPDLPIWTSYYTSKGRWEDIFLEIAPSSTEGVLVVLYPEGKFERLSSRRLKKTYSGVKAAVRNGVQFYGPVHQMLSHPLVRRVSGKTYDVKEILKEYGFRWDPVEKEWVRE